MATEGAFLEQIDALIQADDNELAQVDRSRILASAIERYSHDRPDEITEDESGDGGRYYAITGLASWVDDFSHIISIQYPAPTVASDETPVYLDAKDWDDDYYDGSTRYIFFPNHSISSGEAFRVRYTAPYAKSSGAYATPSQDFYAICNLAAGLTCQSIAVKYARTHDSSISVDSNDHAGRSERFAARARELIGYYNEHMNLITGDAASRQGPAGVFVDLDTSPRGRRYLVH